MVDDFLAHITGKRFRVLVKPNASTTHVIGWDEGKKALRVAVAAVPDKGKANKELVKFLSKLLKKKVVLVSGATSRLKILKFTA